MCLCKQYEGIELPILRESICLFDAAHSTTISCRFKYKSQNNHLRPACCVCACLCRDRHAGQTLCLFVTFHAVVDLAYQLRIESCTIASAVIQRGAFVLHRLR